MGWFLRPGPGCQIRLVSLRGFRGFRPHSEGYVRCLYDASTKSFHFTEIGFPVADRVRRQRAGHLDRRIPQSTESNYEGAIVLTISKPQLVSEAATVSDSVLGPASLSGIPVTGLDPSINTGAGTGYLVNSFPFLFPFLANGGNDPVARSIGAWTLQRTATVTAGHGSPTLTRAGYAE